MSVPKIPGTKIEHSLLVNFREEVARLLGRSNNSFPGAQPVSFARHHLVSLCQGDYFLCEKTDGIRCLLYCTTDEGGSEIHYLIDRKNDFYFVQGLHLPHQDDTSMQRFHSQTLIDGELVLDKMKDGSQKLRYLVFDLIALDNEILTEKTFDKRIGRYHAFVQAPLAKLYQKYPEDCAEFPFEIKMKKLDKPYGLEEMFSNVLPNLPHGNDGLVFTRKDSPYDFGTSEAILKWKPPHENTIDFKLKLCQFPMIQSQFGQEPDYDAKPVFELCVYFGSRDYRVFATLFLSDDEWESMKSLDEQLDGRLVECYIDDSGQWRIKREDNGSPRFRDDKSEANHISTVDKVLSSIKDGVTQTELCSAQGKIREAWKARHPEEDNQKRPINGH